MTKLELRVPTFKKPVPVRAIIQNGKAPLTVVLLGLFGNATGRFERLWPGWLSAEGNHVLTLDSTFLPYFSAVSRHGVAGNVAAEAERLSEVISAFLKHPNIEGRVSEIGIVGISYGAIEALQLGRMAAEGRLPFRLTAIQAYSPPLRLDKSAELLDEWHREDRWKYTLPELQARVGGLKPGDKVSDSELRAALAAEMRLSLAAVVIANDNLFRLNALPRGNEFDDSFVREEHAQAWTFSKYMHDIAYAYWSERKGYGSFDEFAAEMDVYRLLQKQPAYSVTFLTADDPLNRPEDFARIQNNAGKLPVVLMPRGGHLGYVNAPWLKERLCALFDAPANQPIPVSTPETK
ncbi:MAG TPA: hypothetical protein VEK08_25860 [Planctomycetota bacterium]|nr:hypothetical protein [Planctomycetota bacterium]